MGLFQNLRSKNIWAPLFCIYFQIVYISDHVSHTVFFFKRKLLKLFSSNHDMPRLFGLVVLLLSFPLHKKCPYSELFWSVFSCIRTKYDDIHSIPPNSVRVWEYTDQNNSENGHILRSVLCSDSSGGTFWKFELSVFKLFGKLKV